MLMDKKYPNLGCKFDAYFSKKTQIAGEANFTKQTSAEGDKIKQVPLPKETSNQLK